MMTLWCQVMFLCHICSENQSHEEIGASQIEKSWVKGMIARNRLAGVWQRIYLEQSTNHHLVRRASIAAYHR